ncbi:MAG TPA: hypothetical protein VGP62_15345 [Bryobacteraceae bacterium]|jgi:hypothetical protein|nr:hypothetical protein [Bryobacteraceae bacterium]
MKQFVLISIVGVAALSPNAFSQITREGRYWVETVNGVATATPLDRFRLDTVGNVVLQGGDGEKVTYKLKLRVRARDAQEAEALLHEFEARSRTQSGWLRLTVTPPANISEGPELSVTVPRSLQQVWIETRGGNVQAMDLGGELQARSAGGRMLVDRIKGKVEVRTGGGDIQVGDVGGSVRCYSGAGVIRVKSAGGESWLDTEGGEVYVQQALGPVHAYTAGGNIRIERASNTVFARTAAGLIEVQQADGAVTAESSAGAIQVNAANGVRCESASGTIRLRNVGGALRASTAAGSILAELLSGNRILDSMLSTNAGDITVFIASNVPLTVMARNDSGGATGRIISDFKEIRVKAGSLPGASPVLAEGALNGGGPLLRINVNGGTIYLRREK